MAARLKNVNISPSAGSGQPSERECRDEKAEQPSEEASQETAGKTGLSFWFRVVDCLNPTTANYNATGSLARFENNLFLL
jgi:protein tyrosine phosphatase (PTP) superfamily phosphohydrolase (DUF442 family)